MLDEQSLEVISRFKQSLVNKSLPLTPYILGAPSRGNKLDVETVDDSALESKVVEYDGKMHLVLSNAAIDRSSSLKRRKWSDFYGKTGRYEQLESEEEDSEDEHPFKKIKLTEILSPLNHPSEIITHPAILRTYRLPVLSNLAKELIDTIELEQNNLNWLNKLLLVLNGEDWYYLLEGELGLPKYDHGLNDDPSRNLPDSSSHTEGNKEENEQSESQKDIKQEIEKDEPAKRITRTATNRSGSGEVDPFFALPETLARYEARQKPPTEMPTEESQQIQEDLINYLQVSIQRQQEYIVNLTNIRNGLVRADRLKENLAKWGKEMNEKKSL